MVLVKCVKLDGVRWVGSIVNTLLAQQDLTRCSGYVSA